ncbi:MAG TPA: PAS domain S-box protein [Syntrophales bacterium]|nr:PAS domain S-box protein [Syntrophales bacterium]
MLQARTADAVPKINFLEETLEERLAGVMLQNDFLSGVFDAISDILYCKDTEGVYLDCNRAFALRVGLPKDEIIGKTDFDIFPLAEAELCHGNDQMVLAHKKVRYDEEKFSCPDGRRGLMEVLRSPYCGTYGNLLGVIGIGRDITDRKNVEDQSQYMTAKLQQMVAERTVELRKTNLALEKEINERKKTEAALRRSEERFRLLVESTSDWVWEIDANAIFTYASPKVKSLLGFEPDEVLGKTPFDFMPPDEAERVRSLVEGFLKTREPFDGLEHINFCKDGGRVVLETSAVPILDGDGNIKSYRGIDRDITGRKSAEAERLQLEQRLNRAEKMEALGTLAGGVAHDLNNVLGVLVGYSELLLERIPEGSPFRNYASGILQSSERGAMIIQDLLTLGRRGVAVSEVVNLNRVITDYFETPEFQKLKIYHPHVTFKTDLEENLPNIKGSPVHLGKTVMNLVSNASEAMLGAGEVTVKTRSLYIDKPVRGYSDVRAGDYVLLTVADNGRGISREDIKKIFEPFYTKKVMGRSGTGLGLAVVWGTVKDHEGYIDVESEDGRGSIFSIYLPATSEELVEDQQEISRSEYMGRGETILIVDDVKEQRQVATSMLARLGYNVHAVAGGEEAVAYIKSNNVDLMVLDMIMDPGIDGLDTFQRIIDVKPGQKAIIVSGFSETNRVKKALDLGAGAYVKKPYVMERIGLAIKGELDKFAAAEPGAES